ncbi:MAG: SMP-30/gluconolactonase/LRE family protein [Rhodobiaceae bacterium]|nr:SMP-30/gluconolactonase/LRE family protein [Rhodobiaceae bacterium]
MRNVTVAQLGDHICGWGEGLCWDEGAAKLNFVDCMRNQIGVMSLEKPADVRFVATGSMPTKVLLTNDDDRRLVLLEDGFYVVADAVCGEVPRIAMPEASVGRFNDATCDKQGRIITGNLGLVPNTDGAFWIWGGTGSAGHWRELAGSKGNANGPCFSADGRTLYFADTPTGNILYYSYDLETGQATEERVFANTVVLGGVPDGAAIDQDGCLWVAVYGGGCVARYMPDGQLLETIELPVRNPTDVAFAGASLDRVVVSSAIEPADDAGRVSDLAGALFEIKGANVKGLQVGKVRI